MALLLLCSTLAQTVPPGPSGGAIGPVPRWDRVFLLGLEINPAHNVVHLVLGLLGLALWWTRAGARTYGAVLFVGYAAAFVYGLFAVDDADINLLSLNTADNWFHLASALAGLVIAVLPARRR